MRKHPDYGRSVPKNIIYSDLVTIKNMNALYLRTAHYPNHLYTYMIADRLGIGIMEENSVVAVGYSGCLGYSKQHEKNSSADVSRNGFQRL